MELIFCKRVFAFLLCCWLILSVACSVEGLHGDSKVRGVNLGGWLVVEGWIKPSLFDGIPNGDLLDGTEVQFKSVTLQKYVSADNGGGMNVTVDRDVPSLWETFRLWRISESEFQFRTFQGQFLTYDGEGGFISATEEFPSATETFYLERNFNSRVHIRNKHGTYLQASTSNQLTADYQGTPGWDDNAATFELTIAANILHGDYQLANGYGHDKAKEVLKRHRNTFITVEDFDFLYQHGLNTVRIPVGWWIAFDPNPPAPFIGGTLEALDNAFSWAQSYNIKCIIDLHAAPGSQNGMEHSASRDGTTGWPTSPDYISQTLNVIEFLASRYAKHPALLGIELLNEPSSDTVPLDTLVSYYKQGYQIVRKYSPTAYVIVCQRIGNADPNEIYQVHTQEQGNPTTSSEQSKWATSFYWEWVNEWNVTNGVQFDYQEFGRAQLEVYNNVSFGWTYWTLKNDRKHWDFEWNIRNNYLQLGFSPSRKSLNAVLLVGLVYCCCFLHQIW